MAKRVEKRLDRRDMGVGHVAFELGLRRLGFARVGDDGAQALRATSGIGKGRGGPGLELRLAVAAISATSIPSIDVPLMTPIAVVELPLIAHRRSSLRLAPGAHRTSSAAELVGGARRDEQVVRQAVDIGERGVADLLALDLGERDEARSARRQTARA